MRPEDKVPSLELCKRLWTLGITKDIETERVWIKPSHNKDHIFDSLNWIVKERSFVELFEDLIGPNAEIVPSPDLSELGELLPYRLKVNVIAEQQRTYYLYSQKEHDGWNCFYAMNNGQTRLWIRDAPTEPNARAEMLIALRENEK